ncbi:MAG: D-allulose 6-phosphate 3-epimerase [Faecalibacterium sp.]|nr:D-allulose 6-phosphate 3-epimerase [Ruminococcus sp.]MCM1391662.1 D-allulose 6-phosphate 3-epimerase [Ruminococcus sp.]MCM1486213.1 D-allulose 6-phosphate 3-epimerase [Faecalibacterium sp.]
MKRYFSPSLICMDLLEIKKETEILNDLCDFYHVDIADGHFVKNIMLSPGFVSEFSQIAAKPIDCHLMVEHPCDFIEPLAKAGAAFISPHAEAMQNDAFRVIDKIKSFGCKAGVVLSPSTPLGFVRHYLGRVDKITIMTADPGFAGQLFINEMIEKISQVKEIKEKYGYKYLIEVEGSCNNKNFKQLGLAGAEVFTVGTSGLFSKDKDLRKAWKIMQDEFYMLCDKD